ncbi:hypothetical protein BJ912DRAFT_1143861 [Pholiota molesta]|nr:hypothetical protein BJ912DRAFT_1143861 [Pholiota molesta]
MSEHILRCPQVAQGQSCSPCDELAALDQEISEVERLLATLKAKRPSICGRMNRAHDPLTSKLPVEIVSKIFANFLPDIVAWDYGICPNDRHWVPLNYSTTPFVLGTVCVSWRDITWSTPILWSSISLNLAHIEEKHVNLVRRWLRRSGGCPLYINIYATPGYTANDEGLEEQVLDSFAQFSDRWYYLGLDAIPLKHLPRVNFAHAVMLDTLRIEFEREESHHTYIMLREEMNLEMLPGLGNLYVALFPTGKLVNVDWNKLKNLETQFLSVNTCVETLSNASFLTHCALRIKPDSANIEMVITQPRNTILQHNHLVFLYVNWNTYINTFLPMVQLPALQHFIVDSAAHIQINLVTIADLLRRSHCSLKTLEIDVTGCELEGELVLVQFLAQIPSLETLELCREAKYRAAAASCDSVDHLLTTLSTNQLTFLPHLKKLSLIDMELSWNCLLNMLLAHSNQGSNLETSLNLRPLRSVYFELCGQKYMSIELDMAEKLQHAIEDCLANITILAGVYTSSHDDPSS